MPKFTRIAPSFFHIASRNYGQHSSHSLFHIIHIDNDTLLLLLLLPTLNYFFPFRNPQLFLPLLVIRFSFSMISLTFFCISFRRMFLSVDSIRISYPLFFCRLSFGDHWLLDCCSEC